MEDHPADWLPVYGYKSLAVDSDRGGVLFYDVCDCDACARFRKAAAQIDDINWYEGDEAANVVAEAQRAIWAARKKLHELHSADRNSVKKYGRHLEDLKREERYVRSEWDWHEDLDAIHDGDEENDYGSLSDYGCNCSDADDFSVDRKFMVCDHCRGHALPCNEDAVCQQCELSSTPCVHRWCSISPKTRDNCYNPTCRYAHADHLPTDISKYSRSDYIILRGELRGYLYDGKVAPLARARGPETMSELTLGVECRKRQEQALELLELSVRDGYGSMDELHFPCGEDCGKRLIMKDGIVQPDEDT